MLRHVGRGGELWGTVTFGPALAIDTDAAWRELSSRHRVASATKPYKTTYGLPVIAVEIFKGVVGYKRKHGQEGTARYVPLDTDQDATSAAMAPAILKPVRSSLILSHCPILASKELDLNG